MRLGPLPTLARVVAPADRQELDRHLRERRLTYNEIVAWLDTRGYTLCLQAVRRYAIAEGLRKLKPRRVLHVDRVLSAGDRAAYEALIADPATRDRDAHAWLKARGYPVGSVAVGFHRRRFLESLEGVRQTARLASSITQLAREHGDAAMSDGMLTRFEQVMLEQLGQAQPGQVIPAKDLADLSKSVASAVGSRERFEAMRREFEQAKRRAADAADAAAKGGATGKEVVERVREILGV